MESKHIVIIEDEEEISEAESCILTAAGYRTTVINSIAELDSLLDLNADLFLIDERLPNVSGHIICVYLRSKFETRQIPVMLVSGVSRVKEFADLCEADSWIRKPFDNNHLLSEVRRLTNQPIGQT